MSRRQRMSDVPFFHVMYHEVTGRLVRVFGNRLRLVACLAVFLWILSYVVHTRGTIGPREGLHLEMMFGDGAITLGERRDISESVYHSDEVGPQVLLQHWYPSFQLWMPSTMASPTNARVLRVRAVVLPLWLATLPWAVQRVLHRCRELRARRRVRAGLCKECGYDMRGSATVCPECGNSSPEASPCVPAR
jgi:hypothetical protein